MALVALGVLAVALAGALFPATGFGSAPAGETDLVSAGSGGGQSSGQGSPATAGPTDDGEGAGTPDDTRTVRPSDDADETPTPSPPEPADEPDRSDDDTPTSTPEPDESDDDGSILLVALGILVSVVCALAVYSWNRSEGAPSKTGSTREQPTPEEELELGLLDRLLGLVPGGRRLLGVTRISQVTMVGLVGLSSATTRILGSAGSVLGDAVDGFAIALGEFSLPSGSGLFSGFSVSVPSFGSLLSGPGLLPSLLSLRSGAKGESPDADARAAAGLDPARGDGTDESLSSVEDAWEAFVDPLPVSDPDATTPGEFARVAVDHGDPPTPVERLTSLFRRVRYGGDDSTDERTRAAADAVGEIRDHREGDA